MATVTSYLTGEKMEYRLAKHNEHDQDVEALDMLIRVNVLRHQWESSEGLKHHTDGIVLLCSCGAPVMVVRAEDLNGVLREPLDLRRVRAAHSRHVAEKLGEALRGAHYRAEKP